MTESPKNKVVTIVMDAVGLDGEMSTHVLCRVSCAKSYIEPTTFHKYAEMRSEL